NMTVSQVWDYGRTNAPQRIYVDHEGSAQPLPQTGNVLVDFSAVNYINGAPPDIYGPTAYTVRMQEVTHDPIPKVVFDLQLSMYDNSLSTYRDCTTYRAQRIGDLYPHPARPVEDLTVSEQDGMPLLQFAADDARTYSVQASSDLMDWTDIGAPTEDDGSSGQFEFADVSIADGAVRFYRVVTK
ncbi:MAG TPA: hypothetical protein VG892_09765, partial [Terriglobales bacterium]|nr:hypothetical protein [Terriglobales bacterium]